MLAIVNFLILSAVLKVQELIPYIEYTKPVLLALIVGLVGYFFVSEPTRPHYRLSRAPFNCWLLFSIGMVIGLPTSLYFSQSMNFLLYSYTTILVLMMLVVRNLATIPRLEKSGLSFVFGFLMLGTAIVVAPRSYTSGDGPPRLTVTYSYDPNDIAMVAGMSIPFIMYWMWRGGFFMKGICLVSLLLTVFLIYRTGSRGGMVCAAVSFTSLLLMPELGGFMRLGLLSAMLFGGAAATQTHTFRSLIEGVKGEDYNATAEDGRLEIWKRGIGYAARNPLTGVGVKCFEIAEGTLSGRDNNVRGVRWAAAHNSFVQVLAETGLPAFLCWMGMIGSSYWGIRRQRSNLRPWRYDPDIRPFYAFAGAVQCSILAYCVGGFFLSAGYTPFLYLLVAYSLAISNIGDEWFDVLLDEEEEWDSEEAA